MVELVGGEGGIETPIGELVGAEGLVSIGLVINIGFRFERIASV
jgi:hypothetical protein